jgi:hypothetical protein
MADTGSFLMSKAGQKDTGMILWFRVVAITGLVYFWGEYKHASRNGAANLINSYPWSFLTTNTHFRCVVLKVSLILDFG